MPFYRLKFGIVHVKGTKLPEPCAVRVTLDDRQVICLAPGDYLCDGPGQGRKTCDMPICPAHATQTGPNQHLCPNCRTNALDAAGQRSLFTHLVS